MSNSIESVKLLQKEIDLVIKQLENANKEIIKLSESARNVSTSFKGVKSPEGLDKGLKQSISNTEQLNAIIKEQERLERLLISTIAKKTLAQESTARAVAKEREEVKILRREQTNQVKAISELSTAYEKLSAETNLLIREYKDLAVQQAKGANLTDLQKKRFETLGKTIKTNQKVLKDTDAEVGQFSRNVGNYAGSFNGLSMSIAQIAREAPAAAVSLNTFVLGISNNIPMLQDELTKLIAKNKELISQDKPTVSVFRSLASALVSPQVILAGLVTVFTLYNKQIFEFISRATKGADKTRNLAEQQKILNSAYKEGAKAASSEIAQLQLLLAFSSDATKSTKDRNKAVDKLIKSSGGLIKEQDRLNILNGKAVEIENKLVKAILNRAIVQQLQQKISEDVNKLLDNQIKIRENERKNLLEIDKLRKLGLITSKEEVKAIEELNKKIEVRNELRKRSTQRSIDFIASSNKASQSVDRASKRVDENNKTQKENEVIQKNINSLIKEALKLTDNYTLSLDENTKSTEKRNRVTAIGLKTTEDQVKQLSKLSKLFNGLFSDFGNESLKEAQKDLDSFNFKSVERYLDALKNAESFKLPEIDQSSIDEMQARFAQLKIFEILDEEVKGNLEDGLEDLGGIISRFTGVNGQKFEDFFGKIFKVGERSFEGLADIAESSFDVLGEITNAYFNNKIQQYENDIQANNEYYENLLENENLTDQERAKLELDRRGKEEELRKKQRKEEEKAAKFQKAIALAQIAVDLAKTITAINLAAAQLDAITFGVGGTAYRASALPQAIGLAAVQTAAVLASPIPKFSEGGVMDHDGLMMINDHHSGRLEIVEREGQLLMSTQKDAIVQGKKGDIIHKDAKEFLNNVPEEDLLKDINKYTMIATIQNQMNSALRIENKKIVDSQKIMTDRIVKAIQRNKTNVVVNNNNNIGRELAYFNRGDF